jgi:hypothetical protein
MPTVRIWTLEPDHDAKAIKRLANKLVTDLQLGNLSIQTADKEAFLKYDRGTDALSDTLTMATQHCLQKDDCVIFVIDPRPPIPTYQRQQKSDSLIHHVEQIVDDDRFVGKVFLAQGVQELKAWLPVACKSLGIASTAWQEKWDSVVAPFHEAFADTPEDEVARDFEEALAEVRRERT